MCEYEFLCTQKQFSFSLLVTLGSEDGSGSTHLQFSMPMCQSCSRASPTMARVSGAPKNPAFVPTAQTKSLLMISISLPRWECFINSACLVRFLCHSHPFCLDRKGRVNYLHHAPSSHLSIHVVLGPSLIY